jgi:FkbM family methyltransferase
VPDASFLARLDMSPEHRHSGQLSMFKKLAATVMRRLPVEIRRVRMWRDDLYDALGAGGWDDNDAVDSNWPATPQIIKGRVSRMRTSLNLQDWMQRRTYFTGRFYQEELEEILSALLRPGDNFVDVGANIGLVTLHAASLVGSTGNLWAFEPNPDVFAHLERHLELNAIRCRALNMGLGANSGTMSLKLFGRHTGKATLVDRIGEPARTLDVDIRRGDDVLDQLDITKPTVFKIDVEGFETPVIEGLGKLLDGEVALLIEVSRSWLERAGSSADELHSLLDKHGLSPFSFELTESRMKRTLAVNPLPGASGADQYDCLFMRRQSIFTDRLGPFIVST